MNHYNNFAGGGQTAPEAAGSVISATLRYPLLTDVFPAEKYTDILVELENLILGSGIPEMDPARTQVLEAVRLLAASGGADREEITDTMHVVESGKIYYASNASQIDFKLPPNFPLYGFFHIRGFGVGGFKITLGASQKLFDADTTFNDTNPAESNNQFDTVHVECVIENTTFQIVSKNTV